MDRPERRRWDAGNSAFGSDRVKIDNSLPAGGHTSGNAFAHFGANCWRLSLGFGVSALLQRRQRRKRMVRPDRRPAARRTPRPACADRDRFPDSRNSVATAPRSTTPSRNVSGGSSGRRAACSVRRVGQPARRRGMKTRSTASSIWLSIGSSVTTQFCTTVAATRPATRKPSAPCRVRSKPASSRGSAASPPPWRWPRARRRRRRGRHAGRSPECPQPQPARSRQPWRRLASTAWPLPSWCDRFIGVVHAGATASGSGNSNFARASAAASARASRRLASRI